MPQSSPGWIQWGSNRFPKTCASNFINQDFLQFRKQLSRHKAGLLSIILPQHCCEVYFIPLTVSEAVVRLDCQILLKLPSLTLLAGPGPATRQAFSCINMNSRLNRQVLRIHQKTYCHYLTTSIKLYN